MPTANPQITVPTSVNRRSRDILISFITSFRTIRPSCSKSAPETSPWVPDHQNNSESLGYSSFAATKGLAVGELRLAA